MARSTDLSLVFVILASDIDSTLSLDRSAIFTLNSTLLQLRSKIQKKLIFKGIAINCFAYILNIVHHAENSKVWPILCKSVM